MKFLLSSWLFLQVLKAGNASVDTKGVTEIDMKSLKIFVPCHWCRPVQNNRKEQHLYIKVSFEFWIMKLHLLMKNFIDLLKMFSFFYGFVLILKLCLVWSTDFYFVSSHMICIDVTHVHIATMVSWSCNFAHLKLLSCVL